MKRREFLGQVAQAIAGLGLIDAAWLRCNVETAAASSSPYYQVAQPTGRKLALLIGINQYPSTQPLGGCLTDVELQRELLIHRFGFKAVDILTLTEQQATRQQIEAAFIEHLTGQVQPGDVVIFHFSGYGRRVGKETGGAGGAGGVGEKSLLVTSSLPVVFNSLVSYDGEDLWDETLWLLLRSLPTNLITTILDTSFNPADKILPASLQIRSFPQAVQGQIVEAELDFQKQIQQKLLFSARPNKLNGGNLDNLYKPAPNSMMPGVVLLASGSNGLAHEVKWNGLSAGLFTYALTQYLWETTRATTVQVSLSHVSGVVKQLVGNQQPQISEQKNQQQFDLTYHLCPEPSIGADGVVKSVEEDGKTVQLWLGGILPTVLEYYEVGSKLTLVPLAGEQGGRGAGEQGGRGEIQNPKSKIQNSLATPLLQVRSRTGLIAKAQIVGDRNNSVQVGQLVQEAVRVLPGNIHLTIALDPSLERIERVDATSAFAAIPHVSLVTAGEQLTDYVFGRVPEAKPPETSTISSALPASRYGLFSLDQKLIPNSAGELGEAVKVAVQRLSPKLQTLLAAKLWRLTTNEGSSLLNVKATLEIIDTPNQALMQRETQRSQKHEPINASKQSKKLFSSPLKSGFSDIPVIKTSRSNLRSQSTSSDSIPIPIGSRIQYRVHNNGDRPVYLLLLGLDSSKNAIALFSSPADPNINDTNTKPILLDVAIAPGQTIIVPQTAVDFEWVIHKPTGLAEHQLIFSSAKFTNTAALGIVHTQNQQYISVLSNPFEVAQAIMQDLHNASALQVQGTSTSNTAEAPSSTTSTYSLDVNNWASLSFVYQVT